MRWHKKRWVLAKYPLMALVKYKTTRSLSVCCSVHVVRKTEEKCSHVDSLLSIFNSSIGSKRNRAIARLFSFLLVLRIFFFTSRKWKREKQKILENSTSSFGEDRGKYRLQLYAVSHWSINRNYLSPFPPMGHVGMKDKDESSPRLQEGQQNLTGRILNFWYKYYIRV